jgi:hypothetical protein
MLLKIINFLSWFRKWVLCSTDLHRSFSFLVSIEVIITLNIYFFFHYLHRGTVYRFFTYRRFCDIGSSLVLAIFLSVLLYMFLYRKKTVSNTHLNVQCQFMKIIKMKLYRHRTSFILFIIRSILWTTFLLTYISRLI